MNDLMKARIRKIVLKNNTQKPTQPLSPEEESIQNEQAKKYIEEFLSNLIQQVP